MPVSALRFPLTIAVLAATACLSVTATAQRGGAGRSIHDTMGSLDVPAPMPHMAVTLENGRTVPLASLLRGHTTAVQLIFTGCGDTCPIQGANFAHIIAGQPASARRMQMLSITITPVVDTPSTMRQWRQRWSRDPRWQGLVPASADLPRLQTFLKGEADTGGSHTTQVFLFDRNARLVYRSREWPRPQEIGALMTRCVMRESSTGSE